MEKSIYLANDIAVQECFRRLLPSRIILQRRFVWDFFISSLDSILNYFAHGGVGFLEKTIRHEQIRLFTHNAGCSHSVGWPSAPCRKKQAVTNEPELWIANCERKYIIILCRRCRIGGLHELRFHDHSEKVLKSIKPQLRSDLISPVRNARNEPRNSTCFGGRPTLPPPHTYSHKKKTFFTWNTS